MAAKRIKKRPLSRTRYWVAMGTLAVYTTAGSGKIALAQEKKTAASRHPEQIQSLPVRRYDIAAGPLESVVRQFAAAAGVKISAAETDLLFISSPGVSGSYTLDEALRMLLTGTGVSYHFAQTAVSSWD